MRTLITNGEILTATDRFVADILIDNEKITGIGKEMSGCLQVDRVIDASGLLVFPGGIDPHTHLDMPFMGTKSADDFESGTKAALFGGTTTVIDYAIQQKGGSAVKAFNEWMSKAEGKACGDYAFHIAVTDYNEKIKEEIKELFSKGVTSYKIFMAYKNALMIDDRQIVELMKEVNLMGGLIAVHATNGDMIDHLVAEHRKEEKFSPIYHYLSQPEITEAEASGRFIDISYHVGHTSYIVHLTCEGALNRVREATKRNQKVLVETCIHYLLLDASLYEQDFEAAKWVISPPLRQLKDQETLWAGLNQGLIQVVATDHCPFRLEQKRMGEQDFSKIPNGLPAIENRLELLFSEGVHKNRISANKFVEVTSTNVAKIFGMFPQKGTIAIGSDADLVLFDPNREHTLSVNSHHMNVDYSAFEGWRVKGKTKTVLLRGKVVIENEKFIGNRGDGKYIARTQTF